MVKKLFCLFFVSVGLVFAGCGQSEPVQETKEPETSQETEAIEEQPAVETEKTEEKMITFIAELDLDSTSISYIDGFEPDRTYASDFTNSEKNPFSIYDGYYSFADDFGYNCNVKMEDGFVCFETRGESSVDETTEMYIEENQTGNHAYVELDGKIIQLGKKDMYTLEYTVKDSHVPSYLNAYGDAYKEMYEFEVSRIKAAESAEAEAAAEELEWLKQMEAEAKEAEKAAEEAEKAALEEKKKAEKEKEAKLNEKRENAGWVKAKVVTWAAYDSYAQIDIEIVESNDTGLSAGSVISITGDEFDPCTNDFAFMYDYGTRGGFGNGATFEAIISKHPCGMSGYRVLERVN